VRIGLKCDLELEFIEDRPPKNNKEEPQKLHKIKQGFAMDVI